MNKYFFDSYALFEITYGNEKFKRYAEAGGLTTLFNIAELNYGLKKEKAALEADMITDKFRSNTIKVLWQDIKEAMDIKIKHKEMSIPDCIGYTVAKRLGIKFLTGDSDFKEFENVEFVKK